MILEAPNENRALPEKTAANVKTTAIRADGFFIQ